MTDDPKADTGDARGDPHAFAQASGFIFQVVGWMLVFGGCCIGPLAGWLLGEAGEAPDTVGEWIARSPRSHLVVTADVVMSGVGGLALAVFGFGLQNTRPASGVGAIVTTGVMAAVWWSALIAAFFVDGALSRWLLIAFQVVLAVGATLLFIMAVLAYEVLRRHPPPPEEPVTDELLERLTRKSDPPP